VNRGDALSDHRRHQDVLGRTHRRKLQLNLRAAQVLCFGDDTAVLDVASRTQLPQARLMHIQRARPDGITTGQRDLGPLAPSDQRSEYTNRRPELTDRGEIRVVLGFVGRGDAHDISVELDRGAQTAQDLRHQRDVQDVRAVGDRAGSLRQERCRHQLQYAVFGPPDSNFAR
jgi:hypothetical protein